MAKKKAASKATSKAPEKEPAVKIIANEDEAVALVKERFPKSPDNVAYVVLENCNIFYGHNKAVALKYAKTFGLKYFDIKT